MKKGLTIVVLMLVVNTFYGQKSIDALFIGNSYTASNNLPQLIADVALSVGDTFAFGQNLIGGATLQVHASNGNTLQQISEGPWDYVVIQAQSQEPSFPIAQVQANTFPYAAQLNDSIEANQPCGETMFYMTWGRENGDANNCPFFPPLCTYEGMDSMLRMRYEMMAAMNDAELAPVGAVWRYIRENHPSISLYTGDGSHPSPKGSYVAACTFYTAIFRKDPTLITYDFINATDAMIIRNAVKTIVYDDLSTWNIGIYDPILDFDYSTFDNATFGFTNNSLNAQTFIWDFGDGNTDSTANPTHTYDSSGTYIVTLTTVDCGETYTFSDTLTAFVVSTNQQLSDDLFQLSPNPTTDFVQITTSIQNFKIYIYNQNGQLVGKSQNERQLDLSNFPKGLYYVNIEVDGKYLQKQLLKN